MKNVKFCIGWTVFALFFEATVCSTHNGVLFVDANSERILRGSPSNSIQLDGILHRELPEASTRKKNNKNNKKEVDAKADNKKDRNAVTSIAAFLPEDSDIEDSGRDKIESPNVSSASLQSSKNITTESNTEVSKQIGSSQPNATPNTSTPLHSDNVFGTAIIGQTETDHSAYPPTLQDDDFPTPIIHRPNKTGSEVAFDKSEFVTVTQLEPIIFDITVSKFTTIVDSVELRTFFKDFVEDVLEMKSNGNWYPSNVKSMRDISISLHESTVSQSEHAEGIANEKIDVELIINGHVAVHTKNEGAKVATTRTRNAGAKEKANNLDDTLTVSTFQESFDHSLLLHLTFWGVASIEKMLKKKGGLQNPVINSVSVGEKELMAFGTDKDDNYLYGGDHNSEKPHRIRVGEESGIDDTSSARTSLHGLSTLILISIAGSII
mmetsp:Transcript_2992/g.8164  ORF Transcript_2992/g.8164 Transcript_2992/m.8164 type:complete len:436 (+) Transcript_2992:285-1592(+)|eukprot:CAMPEP_0197185146 /NCGR_PEP_ID=MMETSP1423-20130617/11260_1 /TAXON_ID=476441 /ORGANISM="Pseudo-nitzschia heimii, Strain UNC1101" /LENGTH=435 /DNA_ID=CAMNT_0042636127 /DNA_START=229 /DNA_END=1536 /DNA_ORIENTATION=+